MIGIPIMAADRVLEVWLIYANDHFDIGRKQIESACGINEPTISIHHLRFRCVVYEDDGPQAVSPMVYVQVLSSNPARLMHAELDLDCTGQNVSQNDPDTLLNHGDVLWLTPDVSLCFEAEEHCAATVDGLNAVQRAELKCFVEQFSVSDRRLGKGGNASVFVAVKQSSKRQVACKIVDMPLPESSQAAYANLGLRAIPKKQYDEHDLMQKRDSLAREYNVLKALNHPNVVKLEKVICTTYHIYIHQELITGGDLLSFIDQKGALTEAQSMVIVRQLLKAVDYLHDNGVVHRDIKPENVLMTSWRDGARIVLTDFGQSRAIAEAQYAAKNSTVFRMQTVVGTIGYTAPEVFKQLSSSPETTGYSNAIDIWSVGCITATLLTADLIFCACDDEDAGGRTKQQIQGDLEHWNLNIMDAPGIWTPVGRKAKTFIRECLVFDEEQRLTAKQALLHPWFTNRHYAAEIEAAYQRAIQDWQPRENTDHSVEFIDTTDVVAAALRTEPMNPLPEETKSRHFHHVLSPTPVQPNFLGMHSRVPQQKQNHPPLPTISEDAEETCVEPETFPLDAPLTSTLANSTRPFAASQAFSLAPNESMGRLSIEDFGPPQTQFSFVQTQDFPNFRPSLAHVQSDQDAPPVQPLTEKLPYSKLPSYKTQGEPPEGHTMSLNTDGQQVRRCKRPCC